MKYENTVLATITLDEIEKAETKWTQHKEGLEELERFLGTVETYGAYLINKPNLSNPRPIVKEECYCNDCVQFGVYLH